MEAREVRELGEAELREATRKVAEQLFRIRFQLKLGQNEGVKKLQALKKDIARLRTVERERALGIRGAVTPAGGPADAKTGRKQQGAGEAS